MLSPRLTNCPECSNIPDLLKKINCKLAELGNSLYNNISYMLNQPIAAGDIIQLIAYRRILTHKYCNPEYVHNYSVAMIASKVIRLTAGCVSRCNELERCLEVPCDITVVENPPTTTTTSTTLEPTTTTTTTASELTTTTTSSTSTSTSTTTTTTTGFPLSSCSVLINEVNGNIVGYNTSTNESRILTNLPFSNDIANTATKMWLYYNIDSIIKEYNITLNPWTLSYNRDISYPVGVTFGAGLGAIDNVTLITTNNLVSPIPIIEINITGSTAIIISTIASLDPGYSITGDILLTTTGKVICTANSGSVYKLFQYDKITGTKEAEVNISGSIGLEYPLGLAENSGNLYILCSGGSVYQVNLNIPHTLTLSNVGDFTVSGSSQSPECATVNLIIG